MTSSNKMFDEKSFLLRNREIFRKIKANHNIKIQFFGEGLPILTEERKQQAHKESHVQ